MIITCKRDIPFRWICFSILPWASFGYTWSVCGVAFIFSLRKFIENPAGLTFILSIPTVISIVVAPCTNFLSDRIWTRYGRRKPFIMTSWTAIMLALFLMPLMPNFWSLLAAYMVYSLGTDLNTPLEPLKQEIIPPHERGRATGMMQWCTNLAGIVFYFIALGRFDDVSFMAGVPVVGESVIYWSAGLLLSVMLLLIMLGIREIDQKSPLVGQRLSFRNVVGGLLDLELWPVYLLVFGAATLNAGLGPLSNLLYTDQWNYSKQDMGINVAVGGVLNMFIIGLLTFFADKLNRMKAYRALICLSVALNFCYFSYVTFILPDQRPSLVEIIVFGETGAIIGLLTAMVYIPLVYDYIRRNKMGTYGAGAGLVNRITSLITLNGVGLFIWGYATLFQPPAGEMTRVVLGGDANQKTEIRALLQSQAWTYPEDGAAVHSSQIVANAWQANGVVSESGRCWEVRLKDRASLQLAEERDRLLKEQSPLLTQEKMTRDTAHIQTRQGHADQAKETEKKAVTITARLQTLNARVSEIDSTLTQRSEAFQKQVTRVLGPRMIAEGDQILDARSFAALEIILPTTRRPDVHSLEKTLGTLRQQLPSLIDLRPVKTATGYSLVASVILDKGVSESTLASEARAIIVPAVLAHDPDLFQPENGAPLSSRQRALRLDLMTVEEPLDSYVSPIHRIVNVVLSLFDAVPKPDRKLSALARSLRVPAEINHVRIEPGPAPKTIRVTAVLPENAPVAADLTDLIAQRMQSLQPVDTRDALFLPQARVFYDRIEKNASTQRLTIARPILATAYAPMKYNYMSGYLWMLLLGLVGIGITFAFSRLEAKGYIHKRGVEEAQVS